MLTYAIGDVHGMSAMLRSALDAVRRDAGHRRRRIVFLGDYVDRGPDSRGVLSILRAGPPDPSTEEFVCLMGNHEEMLLDAVTGSGSLAARRFWMACGAEPTLACYPGGEDDPALADDAAWLRWRTRPFFADDEGRLFVHAGLRPGLPIEEQSEQDMRWILRPFTGTDYDFGAVVVHGHRAIDEGRPEIRANTVSIDTGACFPGGWLTVAVFEPGMPWPDRYYRVAHAPDHPAPAERTDVDVVAVLSEGEADP